jgi:glycerate kinase
MLGFDRRDLAGAGAAGGLGFAFAAFANARIAPGVELVAEMRDLRGAMRGAAICFTGEGSIDAQTLGGKTVLGVASIARGAGVRVVAFGGRVTADAETSLAERGIVAVPIADGPLSLECAFSDAPMLLERAACRISRLLLASET